MRKEMVRVLPVALGCRDDEGGAAPVLYGELARFDEWTEIDSFFEGHFMERVAPTAFDKTISEGQATMRVLFNHGKDPSVGSKPLGPIRKLEARSKGVHYEVELLDTSYNRDIQEMLRADPPVLGSSFRFEVLRQDRVEQPRRSRHNPQGLPEVTLQEVRMREFGPVTFPAYKNATASLRSLTDSYLLGDEFRDGEPLEQLLRLATVYFESHDEDTRMAEVIERLEQMRSAEDDPGAESTEENDTRSDEDQERTSGDEDAADDGTSDRDAAHEHAAPPALAGRRGSTYRLGKEEKPSWLL